MKTETKKKIRDWVMFIGLMLIWTALLSFVQGNDAAAREHVAWNMGYTSGMREATESDKIRSEIALQWWAGSTNMTEVRNRLCGNVNKPKVKK